MSSLRLQEVCKENLGGGVYRSIWECIDNSIQGCRVYGLRQFGIPGGQEVIRAIRGLYGGGDAPEISLVEILF